MSESDSSSVGVGVDAISRVLDDEEDGRGMRGAFVEAQKELKDSSIKLDLAFFLTRALRRAFPLIEMPLPGAKGSELVSRVGVI